MKSKVIRAKIVGYVDSYDDCDTANFIEVLDKIRETGCAKIVKIEIVDKDSPLPKIEQELVSIIKLFNCFYHKTI